jgi:hypothetical protein
LDAGSINVLGERTFVGQGLLGAVHSGERRLVTYAADPAVRVAIEESSSENPVSKVVINKGVMITTKERREGKTYKISNADVSPREVIIEHPARPGWKLGENFKPEESSASLHRFKVKVGSKQSAQLVVEEFHAETAELALTNLTSDQVALLTEQKRVTPAMERAFRQVLDQRTTITNLERQLRSCQQETEAISADQARVRENMKALKGGAEERTLTQRYTRQLDEQEDRLAILRRQTSDLREKRQQAGERLDQILSEITLSETF